jgi:hypothetical protein
MSLILNVKPNDFVSTSVEAEACIKCGGRVCPDNGDTWGCIAQVRNQENKRTPLLSGGLVCGECGESFRVWLGVR